MKTTIYISVLIIILFGCLNTTEVNNPARNIGCDSTKNIIADSIITNDSLIPILGNRFSIIGDFNGDGKKESLFEHYISKIDNKETNKSYANAIEYDELVKLICKKEPMSFLSSNNLKIDTLNISAGKQLFGLMFLKNEGDLDGDNADEVSYIVDWADWSNLNTYHIMSYKNNKWVELGTFPILEFQLDNPILSNGMIKKNDNSIIECYYNNNESMLDTMIFKLNNSN
ncbi:MAG: hypothetical protein PF487_04850 [Bacteroidales bacterium]|jgi:hypothetical protein|nr:hypothetical protein [Bacteroidales bacterium]